jgi:hypothetical protein
MKRNAIIIAGILFAAGASQAQQDSYDRYKSPSQGGDTTSSGSISAQVSGDNYEANANEEFQINDSERDTDYEAEQSLHQNSDISADSSHRGGSLDARRYLQHENNDELEGVTNPLNPGSKADSSIRGGSIYARERDWNHDAEPSSGHLDHKRRMLADSSIRGGSIDASGGREATKDGQHFGSSGNFQYDPGDTHDDFGQGSSATWESDKGHGAVRGSASSTNWNPDDDLLRDGNVDSESTIDYERNNDASVGGAVSSEYERTTLNDVDLDFNAQ